MRPKTNGFKKITLSLDERDRALLDALARLNHSGATALVEKWIREKAVEEGSIEPEAERNLIIAEWKRKQADSKGKGTHTKVDLGAVQSALKRMPPAKGRSEAKC